MLKISDVIVRNDNFSVCLVLTALRIFGFYAPDGLNRKQEKLYKCYTVFCFMFLSGTYLIIQVVDMYMIWGNLPLMSDTAFLLFTNMAQATKLSSIVLRQRMLKRIVNDADDLLRSEEGRGREIVKSCNRETTRQMVPYMCLTTVVVVGWAGSAEKNQLPLRAWYPYDTSKSPAYELTYVHQVVALFIAAYLNVGKDCMITSLIAQCRCRMRLLGLRLRTLCEDLEPNEQGMLTPEQEKQVFARLRVIVQHHQAALEASSLLQTCFSAPFFVQFLVSMIIICVTAFQLAGETGNWVRLLSMGSYLWNMLYQVFIYCYQGDRLSEESIEIAEAAYDCPWYSCSLKLRRALLIVMARTRRVVCLTAGGFSPLSLASFMGIVKTSYSFFTVLQQANEGTS